jgi:mono/diheme cytochrome c family protein
MMTNRQMLMAVALVFLTLAFVSFVFAAESSSRKGAAGKDASGTPVVHTTDADSLRLEGEQRFHANCGRCHAAPQKFPPRMMKTVLRHMRVRATITDDDMRLILLYMTQ